MSTVMITGAAGRIGSTLRAGLGDHRLRLTDITDLPTPPADNETYTQASLSDEDALAELADGADLVVHLAAVLKPTSFAQACDVNVAGTQHVLEAAQRSGVPRFLFASSNHAVGYTPTAEIPTGTPIARLAPRPDGWYGATKVAGEALCSLYADTYGMTVVSARILSFLPAPRSARQLGTWLSPGDAVRLVRAALALDRPGHHVCWGVSRNTRRWADLADGLALGFDPQDDAEVFADQIDPTATEADRAQLLVVGGSPAPRES